MFYFMHFKLLVSALLSFQRYYATHMEYWIYYCFYCESILRANPIVAQTTTHHIPHKQITKQQSDISSI